MVKVVIAPNAFKNAISADHAAEAIFEGLSRSRLKCECVLFPVGDGGDGTGTLLARKLNAQIIEAEAQDPLGRKIQASFGLADKGVAVIEMAEASGLRLVSANERNPMRASSFGTGQLIKTALDKGARKIVLAVGGSATVDAGCGILSALGFTFHDISGNLLTLLPEELSQLYRIDFSGSDKRLLDTEIIILCDVKNPLLGTNGAIPVFAPQKGASIQMMQALEEGFKKLRDVTLRQTGNDITNIEHGGAAGGVAATLNVFLKAQLVNGIRYFLELTGFENEIQDASWIITGEGSIDEQTLDGKAPFGVAMVAKRNNIPVIALAGQVNESKRIQEVFQNVININPMSTDLDKAIASTYTNLVATSHALGNQLAQRLNP